MKLVKYLANYIEQEKFAFVSADVIRGDIETEIDIDELQKIIGEGIEAFESTENVQVKILDVNDVPNNIGKKSHQRGCGCDGCES